MRLAWVPLLALTGCPSTQSIDPPRDAAPAIDAAPEPFAPPRGATWDPTGDAVHFRVAAPRATRVELSLFAAPLGEAARLTATLERDASGDWYARVRAADLAARGITTIYYGYRVWGASWTYDPAWTPGSDRGFVARVTADGDRMNPNKLILDPYAREVSHDPTTPGGATDTTAYRTDDPNRDTDSAAVAPKGIVLRPTVADLGARPTRALADDIVYEVHLRGLTAADTALPCHGTYAGAAARAAELADLGVTAVELLPVQETWNDNNDADPTSNGGDNYWGYSTLAFFAPDRRYACDRTPGGPTREFQDMVRAFHAHGVKVLIDVVYNHTAEGGGASLLSLRGLDNATYYELSTNGTGFADHTGVGANTNARSAAFRDLTIDSLAYWHRDLGVDGFRFDLAPVLANGCDRGCFRYAPDEPGNILVRAATELPARPGDGGDGVDLVAEPWAIGDGTYQVGHFPAGWSEWNDQYRDLVRKDVNLVGVEAVTLGGLADRLVGSPGIYRDTGRPPAASINYLVSHDGFTLADVTACNGKNNDQPWPYGPSNGGTDSNYAWDYGGDHARQRQAARTALALLMLSDGVPMMVGGDEVLHGLRCNNNPYNLDSIATWLPVEVSAEASGFRTFTQRLLQFRNAHPALRRRTWHDASSLVWLGTDGLPLPAQFFNDPGANFLAWRYSGTAASGEPARSIYVAYNGATTQLAITLPAPSAGARWYRVADTGAWMEPQANSAAAGSEYAMNGLRYDVAARSLALWIER
ncbi:MAG: glycogen-debranching protein [Deltaproteobacteria bacterium]|nr:glycogen-debranching protein [Deltaproteobacteria bacterium]